MLAGTGHCVTRCQPCQKRHLARLPARRCSGLTQSLARDVRPVPIKIVTVGKGNSKGATLMAEEWIEKIRRYTPVVEVQIKPNPKKASSIEVQKQAEGEKVLKALEGRDWVVLLDERGRDVSSEDIARLIAAAGHLIDAWGFVPTNQPRHHVKGKANPSKPRKDRPPGPNPKRMCNKSKMCQFNLRTGRRLDGDKGSPLAFCIGGPFGHGSDVRARGNESIRLSAMVLNHQVAHVVLLEQLYRGWTILRGEPYHH